MTPNPIKIIGWGVVVALATLFLVIAGTALRPERRLQFTPEQRALIPSTTEYATPFITPGIREPEVVAADAAPISAEAEVLGVLIDNEARAYLVSAFRSLSDHVVNDVVEGVPVSVTYCDRTDCARVLTRQGSTEAIDLQLAGWSGESMLLLLDGTYFPQQAAEMPLQDQPFERTTWGQWKSRYPGTKIYLGRSLEVTSGGADSDTPR